MEKLTGEILGTWNQVHLEGGEGILIIAAKVIWYILSNKYAYDSMFIATNQTKGSIHEWIMSHLLHPFLTLPFFYVVKI